MSNLRPSPRRLSTGFSSSSSCCTLCIYIYIAHAAFRFSSASSIYIDNFGDRVLSNYSFLHDNALERQRRMQERNQRAREFLSQRARPPPPPSADQLERVSEDELRKLSWFGSAGGVSDFYSAGYLADPSESFDKWAQAYRMLGGMIDCDHTKSEDSHDKNKNGNNGNNNNQQQQQQGCSRWMLWASYVNPNYKGGGYDEYFGENPESELDCHNPYSDWILMGVYRQEFYQFIEQISKHLWAINEYEYVVAVAGLKYMTNADCFQVGKDSSGNVLYAGVSPQAYGNFIIGLYTDSYCLIPDESGMTYDDFGLGSSPNFGSKDKNEDDSWANDWWYSSQEYTLTNLNEVYDEYKYCTTCVDYPTYQDGYFIGNDGTDDDDLINQCWKFYSHDSFTCDTTCMAKAHAQGTILYVDYGDVEFGKMQNSFYSVSNKNEMRVAAMQSPFHRLLANAALTGSFLLFVATFLAFAVARRSRFREGRTTRSRRLLDETDGGDDGRSRRSKKSMSHRNDEPDGLFKVDRRTKSRSHKRSNSRSRSAAKSSTRKLKSRSPSYEPPQEPRNRSSSRGLKNGEY